jgi:succinylglutamate desuccinylase
MIDFLSLILAEQAPTQEQGCLEHFSWQWIAEGAVALYPKAAYDKVMVLSAGIHGNETAPIELLDLLCHEIFTEKLPLKVGLLLVLGNPAAIRAGQRYLQYDLNRLFCGGHKQIASCAESSRAEQLERIVRNFFNHAAGRQRYHYDLHTAIRASLFPTFGLFPYQAKAYDSELIRSLNAAELDALVYHNAAGKTFTHFSSCATQAASVTLELGQAKPFGQNDLQQFAASYRVLRAVISQCALPQRQKPAMQVFKVVESIIKSDDDFELHLAESAPNFSSFEQGAVIASQQSKKYYVTQDKAYILFPNIHVKKGLRAGLILQEIKSAS